MIILRKVNDVVRLVQDELSLRWSVKDVAEKAGVCRSTVRRLARGQTTSPHFRTVLSILKAMGYKVQVSGSREMRMPKKLTRKRARKATAKAV